MASSPAMLLVTLGAACSAAREPTPEHGQGPPRAAQQLATPRTHSPLPPPPIVAEQPAPTATQLDPDGNDDEGAPAMALPAVGHFEKVGRHWAALTRVCDFAVLDGALYMAHATKPLGFGGATVTRFEVGQKPTFSLGFNWNREGEPERGGGGGQGFLRVRQIEGRLHVPDADPPYLGLGLATGIEGYVFQSDARGKLPSARLPGHLPPRAPSAERGGAFVLPGTLHGFDVIRFRGKLYASTSSAIPPNGSAPASPGALLTPSGAGGSWQVAYAYHGAPGESSVRLGYMTRFRDRLYVALSPLYGLDAHDFLVIAPPRERSEILPADAVAVRVSRAGASHTLRWYTDRGRLYWISIDGEGTSLRVSSDGERFQKLALPAGAGAPSDVLRVGEHLLVLAEHGLYELQLDPWRFSLRAPAPTAKTPFQVDDAYCAAPLVAYAGAVYAGDQVRGNLWQLVPD